MKIGWQNSMECYTYLRNVTDLLSRGEAPCSRRFGQPFQNRIPFGSLVEYYPVSAWTSQESTNLERKSHLDTLCTRVEFGKVTYWLQTLRSLKRWTHQKSTLEDSMYFPVADRRIKLYGEDQELRTPTLIREHPIRGESQRDFLGRIRKVFFTTSRLISGCP